MDKPDYIHPEYTAMAPKWKRCRDVAAGQDAIHAAGEEYLPSLSEQTPAEYLAYKKRTPFYGAGYRTLAGLVGMVFRKDPHIDIPAAMQAYADDVTLSGVSLNGLARQIVNEVQEVGRCGVLVEFPKVEKEEQPTNLAAAMASNLRPYASMYKAESIINWRIERVNNKMIPTLVVLHEQHEEKGQFETKYTDQLRVLTLENGFYEVRLFRKIENEYQLVEGFTPLMNGKQMAEIPFFAFGPDVLSLQCQIPPLIDLFDLNLSHYRTSADLEHGAHFTGLPTPFIAGVTLGDNETISIGSTRAIVSSDPQATASYLEFTGQGLGALEKLLDRKEDQMAAIGARMLAPEKEGVEAAGTLQMRSNGESSVLAGQALLVSMGIEGMLETMREWAGIAGKCEYRLSTDYLPAKMTAPELTALVTSWQSGAISKRVLFENLQQGEIISAETTYEDEEEALALEGPVLSAQDDDDDEQPTV